MYRVLHHIIQKVVIFCVFLRVAFSLPQYAYDIPTSPALLNEVPQDSSESYEVPSTLYDTPRESQESEELVEPATLYETHRNSLDSRNSAFPSSLYETPNIPKVPALVLPSFYETPEDLIEVDAPIVLTSLYETPEDSIEVDAPLVLTSLYETPEDSIEVVVPLVLTSLYEIPEDSIEVVVPLVLTSHYETPGDSHEVDAPAVLADSIENESSSETQKPSGLYTIPVKNDERQSTLYQLPQVSTENEDEYRKEKEDIVDESSYIENEDMEKENEQPSKLEIFYEAPVGGESKDIDGYSSKNSSEDTPYDFEWAIEDSDSGNSFSHVESRDGKTMQGQYRVLLPDGRTQVVTFYDDGNGYHADVTYER